MNNQNSKPATLLTGKPYTPASHTDIAKTFKRLGWTAPSEKPEAAKCQK